MRQLHEKIEEGCVLARVPGTPHSPEGTGSMEISFVTSKNVNGKEVQAFGGYGFSDWKIPWPKAEILHLLVGSMAHTNSTIQSMGDAMLVLFVRGRGEGSEL
jgi:hypothetical protein